MLIPVVQPNTIMGMLGGINVPRIEEHVTREVAKPLESLLLQLRDHDAAQGSDTGEGRAGDSAHNTADYHTDAAQSTLDLTHEDAGQIH